MMPVIIAVVATLIIAVPVTYFITVSTKKKSDSKTVGNAEERARQIIAGDEPMVRVKDKEKFLSIAVDELNEDKLRILSDEEKESLAAENEEGLIEE